MKALGCVAAIIGALCASAAGAQAQPSGGSAPGRLEVSFGGVWAGGHALGDGDASETTGAGSAFRIFSAASDLGSGAGIEGRIAVRVLRSLEAAVSSSYATPQLTVAISNDIENAPAVTARDRIQQITVGASVLWYLPAKGRTGRLAPFVAGGAGYLRQTHEAGTLIETGRYYEAGGGVKYLLFEHPRSRVKALGARIDLRALLRTRGVAFDDRLHAAPSLGAAIFARF